MSEEDLTNYKTYISDLDITKYIVLDNESNYWYSAEYVDKMLKKQDKEIERLNNIINEIREYTKHKIVECYDEGSTIGEFYKICDIDSKIEELLHKGEDKE